MIDKILGREKPFFFHYGLENDGFDDSKEEKEEDGPHFSEFPGDDE